jgi:hypothetical protein
MSRRPVLAALASAELAATPDSRALLLLTDV